MHLTPDEIANKAFTPSVDGYHQAEVRSFLQRIADQIDTIQSTLPEDAAEAATDAALPPPPPPPPPGAGAAYAAPAFAAGDDAGTQSRLTELESRLAQLIEELSAATGGIREAQAETAATVLAAQSLLDSAPAAVDRSQLDPTQLEPAQLSAEAPAQDHELLDQVHAVQQELRDQQSAVTRHQQALSEQQEALGEQQRTLSEQQEALFDQQRELVAQQDALGAQQHKLESKLDAGLAAQAPQPATAQTPTPAPAAARQSIVPRTYTQSPRQPERSSSGTAGTQDPLALFASDLDDQPLFSDSANDLLDDVLDDVMGDLTDEGNAP